jgi:hypothetical protein
LGKVTSTATTANLVSVFNQVGVDAAEIYFRVKVYYDTNVAASAVSGYVNGHEYSKDYVVMFHGTHIADLKTYDGTETKKYPVYDSVAGNQSFDVALSSS